MDIQKTDLILQYILALASEEDEYVHRDLGDIHLIKYAYLADLSCHNREGETFTGTRWQFYKFGPWSQELYTRIDTALVQIDAEKKTIQSQFEDDFHRWHLQDRDLADELERRLPVCVSSILKKVIHDHANDTPSLLQRVYLTEPMLRAAPGEMLEFPEAKEVKVRPPKISPQPLSKTAQKKRKAKISEIREKIQARIAAKRDLSSRKKTFTEPRYDEVFIQGVVWLDSLAGESIPQQDGELLIAENIWKSTGRFDPDVS